VPVEAFPAAVVVRGDGGGGWLQEGADGCGGGTLARTFYINVGPELRPNEHGVGRV
jgi:hypothetical protein